MFNPYHDDEMMTNSLIRMIMLMKIMMVIRICCYLLLQVAILFSSPLLVLIEVIAYNIDENTRTKIQLKRDHDGKDRMRIAHEVRLSTPEEPREVDNENDFISIKFLRLEKSKSQKSNDTTRSESR